MNVFPVPDGDTGTNMSMTIKNAIAELKLLSNAPKVSDVADTAASCMLRGARGNSGVILSLLFRGISRGLTQKDTANPLEFCSALSKGVEVAYKSVMKPAEGTILTVARESCGDALAKAEQGANFAEVFTALTESAAASLLRTPDLLPALKKAGVVDAGGKGWLVILEGMRAVICGGKTVELTGKTETNSVVNASFNTETEIAFTYCTEYIAVKNDKNVSGAKLRAYLESIGDSVVTVDDDDIIKVHVHTEHPGNAIEEGLKYGSLTKLKIENMKEQHTARVLKSEIESSIQSASPKKTHLSPKTPENEYGFVAVVNGAGIEALFNDLGTDTLVRGGQTLNPSTEDILEAITATPARNVFVLPNNKNVILAAEQAQKLADRNVIVLQSRSIPQGISAMLAFKPEAEIDDNSVAMTKALDKVGSGAVTFAARDSSTETHSVKKGDILALENGKIVFAEKDVTKALVKLVKKMIHSSTTYVTIIYGIDVPEETAYEALKLVKEKAGGNIEVVLVNGGQPVYYYLISAE
jgi:DAK2 domain fusion protein YloV